MTKKRRAPIGASREAPAGRAPGKPESAADVVAQLQGCDKQRRLDNLWMGFDTRPCATCPKGEELVLVCRACGDRIETCQCLAGNLRRTFIDPDTYDPDVDPFIWNTELSDADD